MLHRDIWRARPVALPLSSWHLLHVHVHPHSRQKAQILARLSLKNSPETFLHFYQELVHYYYKPFVYRGLQFWTQGRHPHLLNSDFKGTVSGDGYFFEGLNILISTFCVCADRFQGLSKAFHCPIQLLTFYLLLWNYLIILKMLAETLLKISFSLIH